VRFKLRFEDVKIEKDYYVSRRSFQKTKLIVKT